jgi:hypothetical protein
MLLRNLHVVGDYCVAIGAPPSEPKRARVESLTPPKRRITARASWRYARRPHITKHYATPQYSPTVAGEPSKANAPSIAVARNKIGIHISKSCPRKGVRTISTNPMECSGFTINISISPLPLHTWACVAWARWCWGRALFAYQWRSCTVAVSIAGCVGIWLVCGIGDISALNHR